MRALILGDGKQYTSLNPAGSKDMNTLSAYPKTHPEVLPANLLGGAIKKVTWEGIFENLKFNCILIFS